MGEEEDCHSYFLITRTNYSTSTTKGEVGSGSETETARRKGMVERSRHPAGRVLVGRKVREREGEEEEEDRGEKMKKEEKEEGRGGGAPAGARIHLSRSFPRDSTSKHVHFLIEHSHFKTCASECKRLLEEKGLKISNMYYIHVPIPQNKHHCSVIQTQAHTWRV